VAGKDQPETFRNHLPALAGSAIGTLIAAVVGSHLFGAAGTRYALLIGSAVSGTVSWWGERAIRKSNELAHAKLEAKKKKGAELSPTETGMIELAYKRSPRWKGIHYRTILLLALTGLAVCLITITVLNHFGSRQVANFSPAPVPTVTQMVTPPPTVITVPPTATPTETVVETPSATPTPSPSATNPTPTPTPSATVQLTPSASPSTTLGATSNGIP
jgi:hypothetical protein